MRQPSSYEQIAVAAPPAVTVERLRDALRARGLTVDIPLRLAVIATGRDTSAVVIRPMATLLPEPLGDLGEAFDQVLRSLASEAAGPAVR